MTQKERYLNTLRYKNVDRIPFVESGVWPQTAERWKKEGMPANAIEKDFFWGNDYFGLEGYESLEIETQLPYPFVEQKILEEDENYVVFIDKCYRKRMALKKGTVKDSRLSMDKYLDFPVKDRESFLIHKKRYENTGTMRYPEDYDNLISKLNTTDKPLYLLPQIREHFGFYSMLRTWMGTENLSFMFYDNPALIFEAAEFLTEFIIETLKKAVKDIKFDVYLLHEDMCFKTAPLMSPQLFKKFFLKGYNLNYSYVLL